MSSEIDRIVESYRRRRGFPCDRYSRLNPVVNLIAQGRQRALLRLFSQIGVTDLSSARVLEVGCGYGDKLLELIQLGASPGNLVGNELLEDRRQAARTRLPEAVQLIPGDASQLGLPFESFDFVYQSTVFSSIVDNQLQEALANKMWSLVKPGGGIIWYDFVFNNPANPDVRGVPTRRLKMLFPRAELRIQKVTLAPPIARRVVPFSPYMYALLNVLPILRTHVLAFLRKV